MISSKEQLFLVRKKQKSSESLDSSNNKNACGIGSA